MAIEYVSKDVCEEREKAWGVQFKTFTEQLARIENKLDVLSNGRTKLTWQIIGTMVAFAAIILGAVGFMISKS